MRYIQNSYEKCVRRTLVKLSREESPGTTKEMMLVNGQSGRPEGKCHRNYTAYSRSYKILQGKGEMVR